MVNPPLDEVQGEGSIDMAVSTPFGKSIQVQHLEHAPSSEPNNAGCVLANLMRQSVAMYVELEKTHWHLRLNPPRHKVSVECAGPTEVAREVCTISLRLIASISRLQHALDPSVSPECAALFAAVQEKIAEVCELSGEKQFNFSERLEPLVFHGLSTFRDTRVAEDANLT